LPTDRPRPAVQSYRGASLPVHLPAVLTRQVETLARREGATLFMVLLAAFQALLARYSGQDDLAVGSPVAGRNRTETEGLIGFFVNTLVLRGDLAGGLSFRELLGRARETALAAYMHQDMPFEKLVEELSPQRSLAHAALFQVMLVLQNVPVETSEIRDLRLRPVGGSGTVAKFDLTLSFGEHNGELVGTVGYATDLFDAATIDRLILHYERLLAAAVAVPEKKVLELPLLGEAECQQILVEWNDTFREIPAGGLAHEPISGMAERSPGALAVVWDGGELTYGELDRRSNGLARRLRRLGVGPEVPVGLCVDRSGDLVVGLLGILKAGGAYIPLDPEYPRERLEHMLADCGAPVLVAQEHTVRLVAATLARPVLVDEHGPESDLADAGPVDAAALPESPAYVIYTSGSTGRPKGVVVSHRGLILSTGARLALYREPVKAYLLASSFAFDSSVAGLFWTLWQGGTLVLHRDQSRLDLPPFLALLERQRASHLLCLASLYSLLLEYAAPGQLASLKTVIVAGEACPETLVAQHAERLPSAALFNEYGPTEGTVWSSACELTAIPRSPVVPIGRPIANVRLYLLDRALRPVPAGVHGEICIGGGALARGYLGKPDLTAERFLPDPFSGEAGARFYRTGDRACHRSDGNLNFLGRIDDQVKVRGFRIELGEIEAALLALAGVREAVVVARKDRRGDRHLVAYVVGPASADELRRSLRERLPDYMVPAAFVNLEALPLTPNGKVDRKALPAPEWQSAVESYVAPRTPVEEALAGLWAELLGLERVVGAEGHFFELGGHSLLATRVMSRLRSTFGIELPLRELFEAPTLAGLAARIEARIQEDRRSGAVAAAPPLIPVPREGLLPLSFAQQRLWFIDQLEPGSPLYNMPVALRIDGPLDPGVLALCLGEIVRRHETLRTVFAVRDGAPVQVIQPAVPFPLPVVDLSGLPENAAEPQALALVREEAVRPFDLAHGPLLRGLLLRLPKGEHVVALTMHHIASDGWSMGILVREVVALYAKLAAGLPSPLPELPVQYADFAVWQHSWLRGEVLENEISFWRRELAGLPPLLELPTDRPRPTAQSFRGDSRLVRLPAALTRQAEVLARREGATLFMVLLAAFQALLSRISGQDDLAVGSPVAGRNRTETEDLIGFFVNTLVLRGDLTREPSFRELLGRVRETALAAHLHQDVPFERLVQELAPERSLSHTALFQVMFVLQNAPAESLEIPGLKLRPAGAGGRTARFDLGLSLAEHGGEILGGIEYATDLFDRTAIDRLIGHFESLLDAATAAAEEVPIADLPLLTAAERHQLRTE
ncbi:MAG TPA: amino acid adenylation domain-containing protein, partial [Thermoanaerobaculia bacterium]|nr:amino acid adenylation domain-containing protein [Thermoanaerobaculia bacterium]